MRIITPSGWTLCVATALILTACGAEDDTNEGNGFQLPKSVVTDANLLPGSLIGLDADEVKTKMENGGEGNYSTGSDEDDEEDANDCYTQVFNELKIEALGDQFKVSGTVDFSECVLEGYKESFAGGDYSGLSIEATTSYAFYVKCSGQDFSSLSGKGLTEINNIDDCETAPKVEQLNETKTITIVQGKVTGTTVGGQTGDYVFDNHYENYTAVRTGSGGPCSGSQEGGILSWSNGCTNTTRSVTVKGSSGFEGSETEDDNVGKAEYEKLIYKDIKELAGNNPWYSSGSFEVTYHDWSGTVTFASATSEPIFTMTKGTETVTGTIKAENDTDDDANALQLTPQRFDLNSYIKSTIR